LESVESGSGASLRRAGEDTCPYVGTGEDGYVGSAKIAAIGVHVSRGVTSHGFALNVNTDLSYFNLIVPCGITSKPVTSMARELGRDIELEEIERSVARSFAAVFASETRWLRSLDELEHAVGVPVRVPEEFRKLHGEQEEFWA
jgi:lipoyl(octanoyl) transferase